MTLWAPRRHSLAVADSHRRRSREKNPIKANGVPVRSVQAHYMLHVLTDRCCQCGQDRRGLGKPLVSASMCSLRSLGIRCQSGSRMNLTPARRASFAAGTKSASAETRMMVWTLRLSASDANQDLYACQRLSAAERGRNERLSDRSSANGRRGGPLARSASASRTVGDPCVPRPGERRRSGSCVGRRRGASGRPQGRWLRSQSPCH